MNEIWKNIDDSEFKDYQISNLGRVKSFKKSTDGNILTLRFDKDGYYRVGIRGYNNKYYNKPVHRLVGLAFVYNKHPVEFNMINHIDCDRSNNIYTNLEWCNAKYNNEFRFKFGNDDLKGSKHHKSKIDESIALEIYNLCLSGKYNQTEISKLYNVSMSIVSRIKLKKSWKHVTINK